MISASITVGWWATGSPGRCSGDGISSRKTGRPKSACKIALAPALEKTTLRSRQNEFKMPDDKNSNVSGHEYGDHAGIAHESQPFSHSHATTWS